MAKKITALPEALKVGSNEMELVVFKMYDPVENNSYSTRIYGVNVAKVREIIPMPTLTFVPDMPEYADSLAEVRGEVIPIVDLGRFMHLATADDKNIRKKVIVLEMLGTTVGMIVHDVERIRRIKWSQIKPPPPLLQHKHGGKVTGVTKIDDSEDLLLILDLERVIQDIGALIPKKGISMDEIKQIKKKAISGNVLIVDDSSIARRILKDTLENLGLTVMEAVDGRKALDLLSDLKKKAGSQPLNSFIQLIISDVEMPEMDGLTFTKHVKSDAELKKIPLIINTSLSGDENREKAKSVGADGYLIKFDVTNLVSEVSRYFEN
ncbi:chemotaxis protein CheY [Candidatus Magnetoovum chiemensis]|nr:chemotaxis protein CheY [Candidatus Magnetoovum chiemensis]